MTTSKDTKAATASRMERLAAYTRIAGTIRGTEWAIQAYAHGWQLERAGEAVAWFATLPGATRGLAERVSREVPDAATLLAAAAEFEVTARRTVKRLAAE